MGNLTLILLVSGLCLLLTIIPTLSFRPAFVKYQIKKHIVESVAGNDTPISEENYLISIARKFASSGFGVTDPSILADNFECSAPFQSTNKNSYVAGFLKETSSFQRAIPNFDYRAYGFAVDEMKPNTVWFKIKPQGIISGPFSYKREVYISSVKDQAIEFPIQQLSVTIENNQVTKLTKGYTVDKLTGNTGGLVGPEGLLYVLGEKPSELNYLPPSVILNKLIARTRKPISKTPLVAPFPAPVMMRLGSSIGSSLYGLDDPSLFTSDFQFSSPLVGPLSKDEYLEYVEQFNLRTAIPDLKFDVFNAEVDSLEPDRVWLVVRGSGTHSGQVIRGGKVLAEPSGLRYEGPPEAVSVSINDQGLCYRITAGYVIDATQGNTRGLGGPEGILEAIGAPLAPWQTRSIADISRLALQPLFGGLQAAPAAVRPKPSPKAALVEPEKNTTQTRTTPATQTTVAPPVTAQAAQKALPAESVPKTTRTSKATAKPDRLVASAPKSQALPAAVSTNPFSGFFSKNTVTSVGASAPAKPVPAKVAPVAKAVSADKSAATVELTNNGSQTTAPSASSNPFGGFFGNSGSKPVPVKPAPATVAPAAGKAVPAKSVPAKVAPVAKPAPVKPAPATVPPAVAKAVPADKSAVANNDSKTTAPSNPFGGFFGNSGSKPAPAEPVRSPTTVTTSQSSVVPLSSAAVNAIAKTKGNASPQAVQAIEKSLDGFVNGDVTTDGVYKQLIQSLGSKDAAFEVFPFVIGSLPRGDAKTALNRYYQQFAV